jgi:hypothetical protein
MRRIPPAIQRRNRSTGSTPGEPQGVLGGVRTPEIPGDTRVGGTSLEHLVFQVHNMLLKQHVYGMNVFGIWRTLQTLPCGEAQGLTV